MGVADQGTFHHTCFVVNDVEKAAEALAKALSVSWSLWTINCENVTVRGQPASYAFRVAIAQVGDAFYELIAPHTGETIYNEHLRTKGEGFHHTCIAYPSVEALHKAKDALLNQGRDILQSGGAGDIEWYYFEIPETDSVLEVLFPGELPAPEMTIG